MPIQQTTDNSKIPKTILKVGLVLALCAASLFVYQRFFVWAKAPVQLEYLPANQAAKQPSKATSSAGLMADSMDSFLAKSLTRITQRPGQVDFSQETVGSLPQALSPAVGNWLIGLDGSDSENKILVVDGRQWQKGQASAALANTALLVYGKPQGSFLNPQLSQTEQSADFFAQVSAHADYPFVVSQQVSNFTEGEISVRFKTIAGRIDQGAGILFGLKPNGDYYALRANPLEDNLVLWRFKDGKRSKVTGVAAVTPAQQWHDLKIIISGNQLQGFVNNKPLLTHELPALVSGHIGLWTKADSVVYFDDYTVRSR